MSKTQNSERIVRISNKKEYLESLVKNRYVALEHLYGLPSYEKAIEPPKCQIPLYGFKCDNIAKFEVVMWRPRGLHSDYTTAYLCKGCRDDHLKNLQAMGELVARIRKNAIHIN
jgi:hypothetical protein